MGKLFDMESPLMQGMNKIADLMLLNLLVIICCIPIVTIGASLTAAHYVILKMHRNEEGYITKDFFRAFRSNFKQSTIMWLIMLVVIIILSLDFYLILNNLIEVPYFIRILILVATLMFCFMLMWLFPLQAKFENTISRTIKNAFAVGMMKFPRSLLMLIVYLLPWFLTWLSVATMPLLLLFGITGPIYFAVIMYSKFFKKLENNVLERMEEEGTEENSEEDHEENEEDVERIFSDKPLFKEDNVEEDEGKNKRK